MVALDEERARAAAAVADDATARGAFSGPLHGLPMTIKDCFETEGLVTVVRGVGGGVVVHEPDERMTARTAALVLGAGRGS